jgi:hypothetical protein
MPHKVNTEKDHIGTTPMTAPYLTLSSDVVCLCVVVRVLVGITVVCRNDARSVRSGQIGTRYLVIISAAHVIMLVDILPHLLIIVLLILILLLLQYCLIVIPLLSPD